MSTHSTYVSGVTPEESRPGLVRRTAWGAIFAASFVAFITYLCLALLGMGIGLSVDGGGGDPGVNWGTGIWMIVISCIALFVGGLIAGRLANFPAWPDGMLHGIVVWAVVSFTTFAILTTATGQIVGAATSLLGQTFDLRARSVLATRDGGYGQQAGVQGAQGAEQVRQDAAQLLYQAAIPPVQQQLQQLQQQRQQQYGQSGGQQQQLTGIREYDEAVNDFVNQLQSGQHVDHNAMVEAILDHTELSPQEAQQTVSQWQRLYRQGGMSSQAAHGRSQGGFLPQFTTSQAEQQMQQMSQAIGSVALWTFFGLLLSAVAAGLGGWLGTAGRRGEGRHARLGDRAPYSYGTTQPTGGYAPPSSSPPPSGGTAPPSPSGEARY